MIEISGLLCLWSSPVDFLQMELILLELLLKGDIADGCSSSLTIVLYSTSMFDFDGVSGLNDF
jgi:hypothetical protein